MGFISDRIGSINTLCLSTFAAALSILTLWVFAKTVTIMFAFSIVVGICSGAYLSLAMSVAGVICGVDRLAAVTGVLFAMISVGDIVGTPIASAFLDTIGHRTDYTTLILWTGCTMMFGSGIQFVIRFMSNKKVLVVV